MHRNRARRIRRSFERLEHRRMLAGDVTAEIYRYPTSVEPGELVDVTVRIKFTGDNEDGPWQVTDLDLRESDPLGTYNNIRQVNDPFRISSQGPWYYYTFTDVDLSEYDDGGNGLELFVWAEVNDNDFGFNPDDSSPTKKVTVDYNNPPSEPGSITATGVTPTSATVSWTAASDPDDDSLTYEIQYKKDHATFLGWRDAGTTTTSSKEITGLEPETVYDVRVRATDGQLNGDWRHDQEVISTPPPVTAISFRSDDTQSAAEIDYAYAGQSVVIRVDAPGMDDQSVEIDVWEDDGIGDDRVATINVRINDGIGFGTWEAIWQGDDADDPQNSFYLGFDCGAILDCATYSGASEQGHFFTRPALANSISGEAKQLIERETVILARVDSNAAIDPNADETWIVTHGWLSDPERFEGLTNATKVQRPNAQIMTVDWSDAAKNLNAFEVENWIEPVADWVSSILNDLAFDGSTINLIGHSFGSYVSAETAERVSGGVNSIVGLDPAENIPNLGYNPGTSVNFDGDVNRSWAFHSTDAILGVNEGHESTPMTADEAVVVFNSTHSHVVDLFAYMVAVPTGGVGGLFRLDRLMNDEPGRWQSNRFDHDGEPVGGYEVRLFANSDSEGRLPTRAEFIHVATNELTNVLEATLPGDIDRDGDVDTVDRTILARNWTGALSPGSGNKNASDGDLDGDGDVDSADQTIVTQNWTGAQAATQRSAANGRADRVDAFFAAFDDDSESTDNTLVLRSFVLL